MTASPSQLERGFAIACLLINALIGAHLYFEPALFAYFGLPILVFGIAVVALTTRLFRYNVVYQSRVLLLVVIGYWAGVVKWIDPEAAFSPLGTEVQTFDIGVQMFALTNIAVLGAAAGLMVAGRKLYSEGARGVSINFPYSAWQSLFVFSTVIVLITGALSARSYGPSVLEGGYAEGEGKGQLLGNLQSMGVICLVIASIAGMRLRHPWTKYFLAALTAYYLGWGIFIRGGRLEVLSGILALAAAVPAARGKLMRLRWYHYVGVILLAIFMEAWGTLRGTLHAENITSETGSDILVGYKALQEAGIYHAGTISAIASTFSNTLHMIAHDVIHYRLGSSYFDYVLRTPPEFMYPGRPPDLAWMFEDYGYQALGGFFELAEAYLNFGILGCLVIPFLVSWFLSTCYRKAFRGSFFWYVLLTAMLSVFFRGAWYQTFAFYKAVVTGLILYLGFWVTTQLGIPGRRPADAGEVRNDPSDEPERA
jgi:hypothetical protein